MARHRYQLTHACFTVTAIPNDVTSGSNDGATSADGPIPTYTDAYAVGVPPGEGYTVVPGGTATSGDPPIASDNIFNVGGDSGGTIKSRFGAAGTLAVILSAIAL